MHFAKFAFKMYNICAFQKHKIYKLFNYLLKFTAVSLKNKMCNYEYLWNTKMASKSDYLVLHWSCWSLKLSLRMLNMQIYEDFNFLKVIWALIHLSVLSFDFPFLSRRLDRITCLYWAHSWYNMPQVWPEIDC